MLITSISIITSIALCYTTIYFSSKIINIKLKFNFKNIMCILAFSVSTILIHYITDETISIILYFLILMIIDKLIFQVSISKATSAALISYLVLICSDILSVFILMIFKIDPPTLTVFQKQIFGNILVMIMLTVLSKISIFENLLEFIVNKAENKVSKCILSSITIVGLLYTFAYYNISAKNIETILVNVLTIILFTVILIKLYIEQISKNNLRVEYDKMSEYVKVYEEIIEKDRIRRHENKNQLITIKGMISNKDKKAHEYIDSLIDDNSDKTYRWMGELKNIPIGGLKGLLFYKVNRMRENNIEVSLTISRSLENSKLQGINTKVYKQLCQIIGVYVDNAIEACMESKNKSIGIEIYKDGDIFEFIITNTYKGNLEVDNIDNAGYTTKGTGHGYGLTLVKDILNTNPQFFQNREMINDYYIQHLFLDLTE